MTFVANNPVYNVSGSTVEVSFNLERTFGTLNGSYGVIGDVRASITTTAFAGIGTRSQVGRGLGMGSSYKMVVKISFTFICCYRKFFEYVFGAWVSGKDFKIV